jgi:hypothetical protein
VRSLLRVGHHVRWGDKLAIVDERRKTVLYRIPVR